MKLKPSPSGAEPSQSASITVYQRGWPYWVAMAMSLLIGATTCIAPADDQTIGLNAALIANAILLLEAFYLVGLYSWQDLGEFICGSWLVLSPWTLGYADAALAYWHAGLGTLLLLLAAYKLPTDLKQSDAPRH